MLVFAEYYAVTCICPFCSSTTITLITFKILHNLVVTQYFNYGICIIHVLLCTCFRNWFKMVANEGYGNN